jgi:hypothetical protein
LKSAHCPGLVTYNYATKKFEARKLTQREAFDILTTFFEREKVGKHILACMQTC